MKKKRDMTRYLLERPQIQNTGHSNLVENVEKKALLFIGWECKMAQLLWKSVWQFLKKLNIFLSYNPAITLLGNYPSELKVYIHTKTST